MSERLSSKFAAALLSASAIISTVQAAQPELRADANDTITFRLKEYKVESGHASLKVDASTITENKWKILTDKVTKAAILMPGMDNKRLCPYFDLAQRNYSIDQIEADRYDFQIETDIKPEEEKAARDKRCLIINIPPRSTINWKN